jgi:hypothetical protein
MAVSGNSALLVSNQPGTFSILVMANYAGGNISIPASCSLTATGLVIITPATCTLIQSSTPPAPVTGEVRELDNELISTLGNNGQYAYFPVYLTQRFTYVDSMNATSLISGFNLVFTTSTNASDTTKWQTAPIFIPYGGIGATVAVTPQSVLTLYAAIQTVYTTGDVSNWTESSGIAVVPSQTGVGSNSTALGDGISSTFLYGGGAVTLNGVTITTSSSPISYSLLAGKLTFIQFAVAYVPAIGALIQGAAPMPNSIALAAEQAIVTASQVAGLSQVYVAGQLGIGWQVIPNAPDAQYEVRFGSSLYSAIVLQRNPSIFFSTVADGTYWVTPVYGGVYGIPQSITVTGTTLSQNVVVSHDEVAGGWTGTMNGTASNVGGYLTISPNSSGFYTAPAGNIVNLGSVQAATVSCTFLTITQNGSMMIDSWPDVDSVQDIDGQVIQNATTASAIPMIAVDPGSGTFGPWQPFIPGQYFGSRIWMGVQLISASATFEPIMEVFNYQVSLPTRSQGSSAALPSGGSTITFAAPFQTTPNLQITEMTQAAGDIKVITGLTKTGFTVQITNGGTGQARTINWNATGY